MAKLKYCIQKHYASHIHYDLRLELGGVAKSWAVPKEPAMEEGVKRLAIESEDHNISYMDFEGEIEEGYGAGKVIIWDKGWWNPESIRYTAGGHSAKIKPNNDRIKKIVLIIHGRRLKGRFTLLRFKDKN